MDFESPCADNARVAFLCMVCSFRLKHAKLSRHSHSCAGKVDCDDERVTRYLLEKTNAIEEIIAGFIQTYEAAMAADDGVHLKKMLRLINALTVDRAKLLHSTSPIMTHSADDFQQVSFVDKLIREFNDKVIMKRIANSLMQTEEAKVEHAVKTVRMCLATLVESRTSASVSPVLDGE